MNQFTNNNNKFALSGVNNPFGFKANKLSSKTSSMFNNPSKDNKVVRQNNQDIDMPNDIPNDMPNDIPELSDLIESNKKLDNDDPQSNNESLTNQSSSVAEDDSIILSLNKLLDKNKSEENTAFTPITDIVYNESAKRKLRYILVTNVKSGNYFEGTADNCCGSIYYLNNQPLPQTGINMEVGQLLWFIQDGLSNTVFGDTRENHPLIISNQKIDSLKHLPSSMIDYYLDDIRVNMANYVDKKKYTRARKRSVFFTPTRPGEYYVLSWNNGIRMGGKITVT